MEPPGVNFSWRSPPRRATSLPANWLAALRVALYDRPAGGIQLHAKHARFLRHIVPKGWAASVADGVDGKACKRRLQ